MPSFFDQDDNIPVARVVSAGPAPGGAPARHAAAPSSSHLFTRCSRYAPETREGPRKNASATRTGATKRQACERLRKSGYPRGLCERVLSSKKHFPKRYWVLDNSGSMSTGDGKRFATSRDGCRRSMVPCSRWRELQETVKAHVQLAGQIHVPTTFRLLNVPLAGKQTFRVGHGDAAAVRRQIAAATRTMESGPYGFTPLTAHIKKIAAEVRAEAAGLRARGQKAVVVVATDGLPSNNQGQTTRAAKDAFKAALRSLHGLPVWVVLRLLTDDEDVVNFWEEIDGELELDLDVLDDWEGEARQVEALNPWLNYAMPLHRAREMGSHEKLLDLLDERRFTLDEMARFCKFLFGDFTSADPSFEWDAFEADLRKAASAQGPQWSVVRRRKALWVDIKLLRRMYGPGVGCASSSGVCAIM